MVLRKLTKNGNSCSLNLPPSFLRALEITRDTSLEIHLNEGCLVIRPRAVSAEVHVPAPAERHPETPVFDLVRQLDAAGLNPQLFERISHDGMSLGEFAGRASLQFPLDPVTVERARGCLARRRQRHASEATADESWVDTITAVLMGEARDGAHDVGCADVSQHSPAVQLRAARDGGGDPRGGAPVRAQGERDP